MTPGVVARGRLRIVMPRDWTIWRCPARQIGYLHPAITSLLILVIYFQRWIRIRHHVVHRQVFNASAVVLSAYAAMAVLALAGHFRKFPDVPRDIESFVVVLAVGVVYNCVDLALVAGAILLATPDRGLRTITPGWERFTLALATIGLAILLAWALVDWPIAVTAIFGISLVLHGKVLQPQLRTAASTDAKTGLLNHSGWISAAQQEFARARPVGVLMIDLDHFKVVNDTHGHMFGDEVLLQVAIAISNEVRESALAGRFGGEEFVVLVPGVSLEDATAIAERIRRRIAALALPVDDAVVTLTASIGVAVHPIHGRSLDDLIAAADWAVYAAKDAGRNKVQLAR